MFECLEQVAMVSSVSIGSELHGEDPVPACYIDFQMELGAEVLDHFAKGLRAAFYAKANPKQQSLDGVEEAAGPKLRFDGVMHPLKLKQEYTGYVAHIVWGDLAGSVQVKLTDAKVKKFRAEPKSGGSCALSFQVQAHPSKEAYGELAMLQRREVRVTLEAPKAGEQPKAPADDLASTGGEGFAARVATGESLINNVIDGDPGDDETDDPLYEQACTLVINTRRASISAVQKHLSVGYNRAVHLLERMEHAGIVSPMETDGNRKVLTPAATDDSTTTEPMYEIRAFEDGFMIYLADTPVAGAQKFKTQQAAETHLQKHLGIAQKAGRFERTEPAADPKQ